MSKCFSLLKSSLPPRNVEEASINVCNNKHLDPKHELSEDDTIKDMLEYNNNIIDHNGITLACRTIEKKTKV